MIKQGVRLHGVCAQMMLAYFLYDKLWTEHGYPPAITSGIEGRHSGESDHWKGMALDFRTWITIHGEQMGQDTRNRMAEKLSGLLSDEYYIKVEPDHLHVSYRAKKAT